MSGSKKKKTVGEKPQTCVVPLNPLEAALGQWDWNNGGQTLLPKTSSDSEMQALK